MTGPAVRAVTVDLDDTLFPQAQWLVGAWAAVADHASLLGLDGPALLAALQRVAGEGSDRGGLIDRALLAVGQEPSRFVPPLVSAFRTHVPARLSLYPGALAALVRLRRRLPVVCITDGDPRIQRGKLAALGLAAGFDGLVISDELGGRVVRKPHPAPFRRALDLIGLPPSQVVHVGDRPEKDMAGAAAVGMRSIRVLTGEYAGAHGADAWRTVRSFGAAAGLCLSQAPGLPAREQISPSLPL